MQLLATAGEELGRHAGLGWIDGTVCRIDVAGTDAKVPHMGWNDVVPQVEHALIVPGEAYFLHSYAFTGAHVVATTNHAGPVTAAVARDNVVGVQFHPEKSQRYGLSLLERFLAWRP
jgi:glutamine amidotransferase